MSDCLCNNPRCGSLDLFPGEYDCPECGAPDGLLGVEPCYFCGNRQRTLIKLTPSGSRIESICITDAERRGLTMEGHTLYCPRGCCDE